MDVVTDVGVVVIGRNEGKRLELALASALAYPCIYVDSGSSDGSLSRARNRGVEILSLSPPYSAAKARNAGFSHLTECHPELRYVQFLDGDCELCPRWVDDAKQAFMEHHVSAVTGTLLERAPEKTVYNRLCQMEWKGKSGLGDYFAGVVMLHVQAVREGGYYNPLVIAGEDSEFSVRLRKLGHRLMRIDRPMAWHDADMRYFSQWVTRTVRSGHAIAERYDLHGSECRQEMRSTLVWGAFLPILSCLFPPVSLAYFYLGYRIYEYRQKQFQESFKDAAMYAFFCSLAKPFQFWGILKYRLRKLKGGARSIISYK